MICPDPVEDQEAAAVAAAVALAAVAASVEAAVAAADLVALVAADLAALADPDPLITEAGITDLAITDIMVVVADAWAACSVPFFCLSSWCFSPFFC